MKVAILYRGYSILYPGYSSANTIRPMEIERFLVQRGCDTTLIDLEKMVYSKYSTIEARIRDQLTNGVDEGKYIIDKMKRWAGIIEKHVIRKGKFDLVISESFLDAYVFTKDLDCMTFLDCPTPYVDELKYSGRSNKRTISELREIERNIYERSTFVAFHWETYKDYIKRYVYDGDNLITLNWGCHPRERRAHFDRTPKLVYMGYLDGYWVNKELLARLSMIGPDKIDVFGFPRPDKRSGVNYKGYAKDIDILEEYQFGLITISKDRLRGEGFSAKHLEYISYGLPVLVPDWRSHLDLIKGSIPYNEDNYIAQLERYSDKNEWKRMSDMAYRQAKDLDWDITLRNLDKIIQS